MPFQCQGEPILCGRYVCFEATTTTAVWLRLLKTHQSRRHAGMPNLYNILHKGNGDARGGRRNYARHRDIQRQTRNTYSPAVTSRGHTFHPNQTTKTRIELSLYTCDARRSLLCRQHICARRWVMLRRERHQLRNREKKKNEAISNVPLVSKHDIYRYIKALTPSSWPTENVIKKRAMRTPSAATERADRTSRAQDQTAESQPIPHETVSQCQILNP